jgi:hypothetical protein
VFRIIPAIFEPARNAPGMAFASRPLVPGGEIKSHVNEGCLHVPRQPTGHLCQSASDRDPRSACIAAGLIRARGQAFRYRAGRKLASTRLIISARVTQPSAAVSRCRRLRGCSSASALFRSARSWHSTEESMASPHFSTEVFKQTVRLGVCSKQNIRALTRRRTAGPR